MREANEMRDRLIKEFSENYMEKLFYFCLKKTGSNTEAEDLTQDIALQIITALNKGTIPTNFSAWVWQIARNRYSVWAKEKHNRNESVTGSDIDDYEIEDESVRDIASSLSLSISAVQQRLHRARIILKEGMDMAREFGKRSYNPEKIVYSNICTAPGELGQPWTLMDTKLNHCLLKTAKNTKPTFR